MSSHKIIDTYVGEMWTDDSNDLINRYCEAWIDPEEFSIDSFGNLNLGWRLEAAWIDEHGKLPRCIYVKSPKSGKSAVFSYEQKYKHFMGFGYKVVYKCQTKGLTVEPKLTITINQKDIDYVIKRQENFIYGRNHVKWK